VISATVAWPVLDEPLTPLVVLGGLVVVAATGLVIVTTARRERGTGIPAEVEPATELPA
jgi:drug/metabolite transporter (DMT)-like permease